MAGGPADEALLKEPGVEDRVRTMSREGLRPGAWGVAADIAAANVPAPGYDPAAAGARTTLFYGEVDPVIGQGHGEYWLGLLPSAELRMLPDAGHLLPIPFWDDILSALLAP